MYKDELFFKIAEIYKVLGDPTRLKILFILKDGEKPVKELTDFLGIRQANISKHLSILRSAGIVKAKRVKNKVIYSFSDLPVNTICDIVCEYMKKKIEKEEKELGIK